LWLDSMISSWKLPGGMECRMFCCNYFFLSSGAHIVFADNNIPDPSPSSTTNVTVSIYTQDIEVSAEDGYMATAVCWHSLDMSLIWRLEYEDCHILTWSPEWRILYHYAELLSGSVRPLHFIFSS
jgi:hypothetical protein